MEEMVKDSIYKFIKESLVCTIVPVLFSSFILTYILNINVLVSIILSMVIVYLIDSNICVNYCENKNKKSGIQNLIKCILIFTIGLKLFLKTSILKILINVFIIVISSHLLCKSVLGKKYIDTAKKDL